MSGHSKWANIKHRKGAQDAKRGKMFTRLQKEITISVKEGGGPDPEFNPRLRTAIQNAKGVNMPKDNIQRAISKASDKGGADYQELAYEGYGPGGIAIFVETATDNLNRTVASVRSIFNKYNGSLGTKGSLEFIFDRKGVFTLDKQEVGERDLDELEMELIDGGAEEMVREEEVLMIYTAFEDFGAMQTKLEQLGLEAKSSETQRVPQSTNEVDIDTAKSVLRMIDKFDEEDDVTNVYHNLELTDELMEELNS